MSTAKFNYNTNPGTNSGANFNDFASDIFLGTQNTANKQSLQRENNQNRFTEYMSNTAYQRGNDDMRKAGINPLIMYASQGAGAKASAPSSSSASTTPTNGGVLGKGLNTVIETTAKAILNSGAEKAQQGLMVLKTLLGAPPI